MKYQPDERPFASVEEMNETIIERWNECIGKNDLVYHLGDFAFASRSKIMKILPRLNGNKYLVLGNHDRVMQHPDVEEHFVWMKHYHEMKIDNNFVVMMHYPLYSWNRMHRGAYHFYGHTHGSIPFLPHGLSYDVGVDTLNCYPYNVRDLFAMMQDSEWQDTIKDPRNRPERND